MKIALLTLSVSRKAAGMLDCVRRLALGLQAEQSVATEILGIDDEHSAADLPTWKPLPVYLFTPKGPANFGYTPEVDACLRRLDVELTHTHGLWTYFSVASRRWSLREHRPYMVTTQGMLDPWALGNSRWKKRIAARLFERRHLEGAACLHAVCMAEAESMRSYGLSNPICVIPNGADLPLPEHGGEYSAPWADCVPANGKVLLYLSRLHPKKNLANLIRAWAVLQKETAGELKEWTLVVAGWDQGGHAAELEKLAVALSVEASVRFVGPLFGRDKAAAYRHANAFVLPSLSEGLPLVVLEAWSYGLPVVMTAACNLPEGFAAGAALEASSDPEGLAAALSDIMRLSDSDRMLMGERGRALVETQFTWSGAAAKMARVYAWVLGRGEKPDDLLL